MLPTIGDKKSAEKVVNKITDILHKSINFENHNLTICISIGIVLCPDDGTDPSHLMQHADIAMYHAKQNSLDYTFYHDSMNSERLFEFTMEPKFRYAIESGEFELNYQPKIQLSNNTIVGVEVLFAGDILNWDLSPQINLSL